VCNTLRIAQTKARTTAESTAQALGNIKYQLKNVTESLEHSAANMQRIIITGVEARAAAKEATELGKATLEMSRETKKKRPHKQANGLRCSGSQKHSISRYI
jgi:predicted RNase H-like HicB family nuclease